MDQRQRVNIQYSLDLEELPSEVQRLVVKAQKDIAALYEATKNGWQTEWLSLGMVEEIDNIRRAMAHIDYTLEDVSKIINGYVHYKTQSAPVSPPASNLQDKIETFTNSLNNEVTNEVSD